tara:strand:- start:2798 stop:3970 length:1173 start_codon:yes stop_codon:yes gene_type:complete
MSFEKVHAAALLATVPWIQEGSFQNIVFEWLKLMHQQPRCRKKQDYAKVLEQFRNNSFNRFLHQRLGTATKDEETFVKLVCAPQASTKKDYTELFQQLNSFKQVLEPMLGGHLNTVPVVLLWVLHNPPNLNEIWYKDEVDSIRDSGVCIQCLGTKNLTPCVLKNLQCPKLQCPATTITLCSGKCQLPDRSTVESMLVKTHSYALTQFGPFHQKLVTELHDMFTQFVQDCVGGEQPQTVYNAVWAKQHAQHSDSVDSLLRELRRSAQQQQSVLQSMGNELHHTKQTLGRTESMLSNTQHELRKMKAMQQSWQRARERVRPPPQYPPLCSGRDHYHAPYNPPPTGQYHHPPRHPIPHWCTGQSGGSRGVPMREPYCSSSDLLPFQPPLLHRN